MIRSFKPPRILITEAGARAAVGIVRSLLRLGMEVYTASDHRWCAAFNVRGLRHKVRYDPISSNTNGFVDWLVEFLKTHPMDALIPLGDLGVAVVAEHQSIISKYTRLLMPSWENFTSAYDKILCNRAAERAGIPIPASWYPDEEGLDTVLKKGRYPLVIKPAVGVGARGIVHVESAHHLQRAWQVCAQSRHRYFVQECLCSSGKQYVVDALLDRTGRTIALVSSEKIRFFPLKGGASTLSRSVPGVNLAEASERLLKSIGYVGVANLDFMEDVRDGQTKLLEINPRFGEMHNICQASGVDLTGLYCQAVLGKTLQPHLEYTEGKYLRFMPSDMMWFLKSSDRFRTKPGVLECLLREEITHTLFAGSDFGPLIGYTLENLMLLANPRRFSYRFRR